MDFAGRATRTISSAKRRWKKRIATAVIFIAASQLVLPIGASAVYQDRSGDLPGGGGPSTGVIIGVAVGAAVVIGGVTWWLIARHRNSEHAAFERSLTQFLPEAGGQQTTFMESRQPYSYDSPPSSAVPVGSTVLLHW